MSLLKIKNLKTYFHTRAGINRAVDDISFSIDKGEIVGVVGESGSGKSVTCHTMLGLLPQPPAKVEGGSVTFDNEELLNLPQSLLRAIRGKRISMIFQDPMSCLNPYLKILDQITEPILIHENVSRKTAEARAIEMMKKVGIQDAEARAHSYPHEFSGGMRQRVMIAMALVTKPDLLLADEPTTALDVTVQARILKILRNLKDDLGIAVLFVTHDLGVVAELATVDDFLKTEIRKDGSFILSEHPDSKERLSKLKEKKESSNKDTSPPLLKVSGLQVHFQTGGGFLGEPRKTVKAVDGVDLQISSGQTLGLVGESGCGKTTLGRAILRLQKAKSGSILYDKNELNSLSQKEMIDFRKRMQIIFQDPYASLNPRQTIEQTLIEPMIVHGIGSNYSNRRDQIVSLLEEVGLGPEFLLRYPHEFSGGQRQRISVARALAVEPEFIVCDECVSAMDVSVQAQVLNLLRELQEKRNLTYLFISHDLSVVKFMSDDVIVMQNGKIVESGKAQEIYHQPKSDYTKELLNAVPKVSLSK